MLEIQTKHIKTRSVQTPRSLTQPNTILRQTGAPAQQQGDLIGRETPTRKSATKLPNNRET